MLFRLTTAGVNQNVMLINGFAWVEGVNDLLTRFPQQPDSNTCDKLQGVLFGFLHRNLDFTLGSLYECLTVSLVALVNGKCQIVISIGSPHLCRKFDP
jgi:hypothetical protein